MFFQLVHILGGLGKLPGLQNHQAVAGGEIFGVNDPDVLKIICRDAGVLIAGREIRANVHMEYAVVIFGVFGKFLLVHCHASGRCGAQAAAGSHMGENIGRGDGNAVQEFRTILHHNQRNNSNIILLNQLRGKVAGAVGNNFHSHLHYPFVLFIQWQPVEASERIIRQLGSTSFPRRYSAPQSRMAVRMGIRLRPVSVREYSTFGGTTGNTSR